MNLNVYRERLGLDDAICEPIDHQEAMVAIVYKIYLKNGESFILKISDRKHDFLREVYFLIRFENLLPVPKIIQVISPEKNFHGAILMESLSGSMLEPENLTEPLAFEIGSCLALIHQSRLLGFGDPVEEKLDSDPRTYFAIKFR